MVVRGKMERKARRGFNWGEMSDNLYKHHNRVDPLSALASSADSAGGTIGREGRVVRDWVRK
jgi:hypothetical protein